MWLAIEGVLAKKWPLEKDFESTIEIALREIPNHPAIAWSVIHEIIAAQADINTELTSRIESAVEKIYNTAILSALLMGRILFCYMYEYK